MTSPPRPVETGSPHEPLLDGVRGVAICLVLAVHFFPDFLMPNRPEEWLKKAVLTGWLGVDLFFVLSGFLITGILLRVRGTPAGLRQFYLRRSLRILPLYLGALLVVFAIVPWLVPTGSDPAFDHQRQFQGWFWGHLANVAVFFHSFGETFSPTVNLGHLWSLAVEEHFYLIWPFVVWHVAERRLFAVLGGVIAGALLLRLAGPHALDEPRLTGWYVLTPCRMDALAIGATLCLLMRRFSAGTLRRPSIAIASTAAGILFIEFVREKGLGPGSPFMRGVGLTLVALFFAGGMCALLAAPRGHFARRLIDNAPLRFFGKYSYGIYVIHGCLMPTLDRWFPREGMLARCHSHLLAAMVLVLIKSAISVGLALISWRLLEGPCLRLKERFTYRARTHARAVPLRHRP